MAKIRFYKYVTPPSTGGKGITVIIDGKKVTQPTDGAVKNIKAINSLGATTNSIGVVMEEMTTSMKGFMGTYMKTQEEILNLREDHIEDEKKRLKDQKRAKKRAEGLEQDKKAENLQEGKADKKSTFAEKSKKVAAGAFGFFKGLASLFTNLFRTLVLYEVLEWFSNPENIEKIKKMLEAIKAIGTWLKDTYGFLINMGLDGIVAFMENPFSLEGVFGIIKFITALGLIFAPAAVAKLGLGLLFKLMGSLGSKGLANAVFGFMSKLGMAVFNVMKGVVSFLVGTGKGRILLGIAGIGALGIALTSGSKKSGVEEGKTQPDGTLENAGTGDDMLSDDYMEQMGLDEKADGGKVKKKAARGGWINGPMSGYPVSLDGGRTTSFIGHGTEWVGRRASGGDAFVIPYNTPATAGGRNGLTKLRTQQAKAGGYSLPGFAQGGVHNPNMVSTKNHRSRDGHPGENRLVRTEQFANGKKPKKATGGKIFLHWTAGAKNFKQKGYYHSIIQGDGSIYRAHPYSQRSGVGHTHLRNSQGIGLSVAAMAGKPGSFQWASPKQYESMAAEVARIAKDRKWKESDINVKNVMTHAEAASGKDGQLPDNDNYGPIAWGGDSTKWDLYHLYKGGTPGSGGNDMRNMVRKMLGMKEIPASEDAGSDPVVTEKNKQGTDTTAAKQKQSQNNSGGGNNSSSDDGGNSETDTFDGTNTYLSAEKMAAFFLGKSGLLGQYVGDAQGMGAGTPSSGVMSTPDAEPQTPGNMFADTSAGTLPFNANLDLGLTPETLKSTASIDWNAVPTVDYSASIDAGFDVNLASDVNAGMAIGGAFCPWCKKKRAAGGSVNWDPVLKVIGDVEGDWNSVNPGKKVPNLEKMTIKDARAAALKIRGGTSAMGKYQFLPVYKGTNPLKRTAEMTGLNYETDIFSPANQKKMAITRIMKDRKGEQWVAGKLGDDAFQKLLASEWAGLAYYKDGRGRYDGKDNKAKASWKKVRDAMMAAKGGYPEYDPKKKYQTGDVVKKDGILKMFDGRGWGKFEGGVTEQGTVEDTIKSAETGGVSVDPVTGEQTPHSEGEEEKKSPLEQMMGKMDLLSKYVADAQEMGEGTPTDGGGAAGIGESFKQLAQDLLPAQTAAQSGDQLAAKQQKEDAEKAEAGENVSLTSTQLPAAGNTSAPQQQAAEVDMPASGPYVIPANAYARPRFGLTAEIFAEPVSIA